MTGCELTCAQESVHPASAAALSCLTSSCCCLTCHLELWSQHRLERLSDRACAYICTCGKFRGVRANRLGQKHPPPCGHHTDLCSGPSRALPGCSRLRMGHWSVPGEFSRESPTHTGSSSGAGTTPSTWTLTGARQPDSLPSAPRWSRRSRALLPFILQQQSSQS